MSRAGHVAPARAVAYRVIRRVYEGGAYADRALRAEAKRTEHRDRQLAMRLAYGTVQRQLTLDHLLGTLSARPAERLDQPVLAALRMGLYELLYMSGAPDHAVVHDAVELTRAAGSQGHGLVNAVLRRAGREGAALLAQLSDQTPQAAAIMHSHPEWIARMWWRSLGAADARALMAANNQPTETALRANTLITDAATLARQLPIDTHGDQLLPEALVAERTFDPHGSPLWQTGALHAQSRASMLVARSLAPQPGQRVLDMCAAPGGKTTHLAALMHDEGEIVAVERDSRRAAELSRNAERLHASCIRVLQADARTVELSPRQFDGVLVDPPCSGLGTLQSHPDLRWRASQRQIEALAHLQGEILRSAAAAVRPGGVLVYSTCTISAAENERVIAAFLERQPDFQVDDLAGRLPALGHPSAQARQFVLTLPHRDGTPGFFIARLSRSQ